MEVGELIKILQSYADKYGNDIPVRTFDLDRHMCDVDEVEFCENYDLEYYIYIGS